MKIKKVYCLGCAKVFYLGGKSTPKCLAMAEFSSGPLRRGIDVVGIRDAEYVNLFNDCPYRSVFSLKILKMKRWLLWRINNGNEGETIREVTLKEYSVSAEHSRKKSRSSAIEENFEREVSEYNEDAGEEIREDILAFGRVDGDDIPSPDDPVTGDGVENT